MTEPDVTDALGNIRACQRQLDADGTEVGVSRQALEEVIAEVDKARAEKARGGPAVLKMRDDFVELAQCYLSMHGYGAAREAIEMANMLQTFESKHDITNVLWPPALVPDQYSESGKSFAEGEV